MVRAEYFPGCCPLDHLLAAAENHVDVAQHVEFVEPFVHVLELNNHVGVRFHLRRPTFRFCITHQKLRPFARSRSICSEYFDMEKQKQK